MTNALTRLGDKILTSLIDKIQVTPPRENNRQTNRRTPPPLKQTAGEDNATLGVCNVTDKLITIQEESNGAISWNDKEQPSYSPIPAPPSDEEILSLGKIGNIRITVEKYLKYRTGFYHGLSITEISEKHQRISKGNGKTTVAAYSKAYNILENN